MIRRHRDTYYIHITLSILDTTEQRQNTPINALRRYILLFNNRRAIIMIKNCVAVAAAAAEGELSLSTSPGKSKFNRDT